MSLKTWQERQKEWKLTLVELDITQTSFADRFGFHRTHLNQWLGGKYRPSADGESRMIEALNTIKSESQSVTK